MSWKEISKAIGNWFSLVTTIKEWKEAIRDLPTTNWLTFTGTVMGAATGFFIFVNWIVKWIFVFKYGGDPAWEMPTIIHLDILVAWLAFVAGWMGFSVRQFKHKRETFTNSQGESIRLAQVRQETVKGDK